MVGCDDDDNNDDGVFEIEFNPAGVFVWMEDAPEGDENGRKEGVWEVEGGVRKPNADDCYYFSLCLWISSCYRVLFCGAAIDRVQLANSAPAGVRGSSVEGESADGQH